MQTEPSPVSRPVRRLATESGAAPLISRLNPSVPILLPRVLSDEAQLDVAAQTDVAQPVEAEVQTNPTAQADAEIREQTLAALAKLQTQSIDWKAQLRVFGLSLAAFVIVGWLLTLALKSYTSITLLSILLVLVIHEAGHYLAMRHYGYRNLKMFFIPLFGAAVSGYGHGSVFQESVIYLLGPLPGILIGYGCGLIFLQTRLDLWRELAELFVIINALNLMPVYPLDGGRFVFGLLPRRTYRLQWLLQGLIAAGLFALTFVVRINQLSTVSGIALGGIWHLARANNLANRVRTSPIGQAASDNGQIPAAVTTELNDLIRDEAQSDKPRTIAQYAYHAWAQATAKRPTPRETFSLTALYVLTLASVVVVQAVYTVSIH